MAKFDEMYTSYEGDQWDVFITEHEVIRKAKGDPRPCYKCGWLTRYVDSFIYLPTCSAECLDAPEEANKDPLRPYEYDGSTEIGF